MFSASFQREFECVSISDGVCAEVMEFSILVSGPDTSSGPFLGVGVANVHSAAAASAEPVELWIQAFHFSVQEQSSS
jgi:hypothetical protein